MAPSDARVRSTAELSTRRAEMGALDVLTWPLFESTGVTALVTTRHGGVSRGPYGTLNLALHVGDDADAVVENRRRVLAAVGATLGDLVVAQQVHGAVATTVGRAEAGRGSVSADDAVAATDALVTAEEGVVLSVLVADCAPVVLFDPEARVLGCAHAGWRGALGGVVESTIGVMTSLGARAERLLVGIGPAISGRRYEVGPEVAEAAEARFGRDPLCLTATGAGRFRLDLVRALRLVLDGAGVPRPQVAAAGGDTGPGTAFFSARAGQCGRFGLFARIEP